MTFKFWNIKHKASIFGQFSIGHIEAVHHVPELPGAVIRETLIIKELKRVKTFRRVKPDMYIIRIPGMRIGNDPELPRKASVLPHLFLVSSEVGQGYFDLKLMGVTGLSDGKYIGLIHCNIVHIWED